MSAKTGQPEDWKKNKEHFTITGKLFVPTKTFEEGLFSYILAYILQSQDLTKPPKLDSVEEFDMSKANL